MLYSNKKLCIFCVYCCMHSKGILSMLRIIIAPRSESEWMLPNLIWQNKDFPQLSLFVRFFFKGVELVLGVISFQLWVALDSFPFKRWSVTKKNPFDFGQIEEKKINLLVEYSGRSLEKNCV